MLLREWRRRRGLSPLDLSVRADVSTRAPYPALVIDRHWNVIDRNRSTHVLVEDVADGLLAPPVNALRIALHPAGMAHRIENFAEWSAYLLRRLYHQVLVSDDKELVALAEEAWSYPGVGEPAAGGTIPEERVIVPLSPYQHLSHGWFGFGQFCLHQDFRAAVLRNDDCAHYPSRLLHRCVPGRPALSDEASSADVGQKAITSQVIMAAPHSCCA